MHQAVTKLYEFDIEFHILWDDPDYRDEWTDKIEKLDCKIVPYTKEQLDQYCLDYGVSQEQINKFVNFKAIYLVLHGHYMKSKGITNYCLIYDDDIILKDDLIQLKSCLREEIPCLINEPMNSMCDKSMAQKLLNLFDNSMEYYSQINPQFLGFNAGFQGVSLDMYEDFLEKDLFIFLLELFDYNGIYDENGKEITGPKRSMIDTQEQSFFGIMNIIRSKKKPVILNPNEYFVCPNWGRHPIYGDLDPTNEYDGWNINMKSKVIHFIGHTVLEGKFYGKPKIFYNLVDEYLKEHSLI
jgi:hypothetical protein